MNDTFIKRCFQVDRGHIAYLRFILEGYDGLMFLRTLHPREAWIEFSYSATCSVDAESLLLALTRECAMREVPWPPDGGGPTV